MLNNIDDEIIGHMARTLWLNIYADSCERGDTHIYLAQRAGYKIVEVGGEWFWFNPKDQEDRATESFDTEIDAAQNWCEEKGHEVDEAGSGQDWDNIAPATPQQCSNIAHEIAGQIHAMNNQSMFFVARAAAIADIAGYYAHDRVQLLSLTELSGPEDWAKRQALLKPTPEELKQAKEKFDRHEDGGNFEDEILAQSVKRRGVTYLEDLGHCIMMQVLGSGVAWTDDHEDFGLKLPYVETPMIDDAGWEPEQLKEATK